MKMTREDIVKLSDGELNLLIVRVLGKEESTASPLWGGHGTNPKFQDYCSDLNAIHEAEKTLSNLQLQYYGFNLQELVNYYCVGVVEDYHRHLMCLARIAGATARQRAEAFLLIMQ